MTPRVAILEVDAELREAILMPGLSFFGFDVTAAGTVAELYRHMITKRFDIVVLDIGLPDEDGLSVVRDLRALFDLGIVVLTGSHERQNRIQALSDGADAYLTKPVDLEVIAATLNSLSRRMGIAKRPMEPSVVEQKWHLGTDSWCLVSPSGALVALTVPERKVLNELVATQGVPVKRETLIAKLATNVYDFDPHRFDMLIHRLRRKIKDQTGQRPPVLTSRGAGYLFAPDGQP